MIEALLNDLEDAPVREVAIFRHSAFVEGPGIGLASTVTAKACHGAMPGMGHLHEWRLHQLAGLIENDHPLARVVGMAAINAAVNHPSKLDSPAMNLRQNAFDYVIDHGKGKNVAVVGHFPKVDEIRHQGLFSAFWVFELKPKGEDLGPESYAEVLPQADFVLLSATTLINGTFDDLMMHCRHSFNVLVGPSAPLHPALFECGIDCIAGSVVVDRDQARIDLSQGAAYRQTRGLRRFTYFKP